MVYDFAMDDRVSAAVKRPKLHYPRSKYNEGIVAIENDSSVSPGTENWAPTRRRHRISTHLPSRLGEVERQEIATRHA
jgi:hypothetical protein